MMYLEIEHARYLASERTELESASSDSVQPEPVTPAHLSTSDLTIPEA